MTLTLTAYSHYFMIYSWSIFLILVFCKMLKYWVGDQQGKSFLTGRRCLNSDGVKIKKTYGVDVLLHKQAFIQSVLLMAIFEQRLSFWMIYFKTSYHEIIVKCRWGSRGALSSTISSWWSLGVGSGDKGSEKVCSF